MSALPKPARVVVWSTGGVGAAAIDAIRRRPEVIPAHCAMSEPYSRRMPKGCEERREQ